MKKIITIMLMVITLGVSTSCDDFLNPEQIDLVYNDVFWTTQTDAEVGLNGLYALYRGLMASSENWYQRGDATTGFWKRGWNGGSPDQLYSEGVYTGTDQNNKMWGSLEDYADWSDFYKVVSQANMVIEMGEKIPVEKFQSEAERNRVLGEAYFLRGLVYFNILRIWGNAPYLSHMIESSGQVINPDLTPVLIGRTDDIVIGQNIIADVNKAVSMLPYGTPGSSTWGIRADKGAALALSGHVNLWMHFLAKRERMDNVDDYLQKALGDLEIYAEESGRSYVPYTAETVKAMFKGGSTEAVFELAIDPDANESYRSDWNGVQALTCKVEPLDGNPKHSRSTSINFIPRAQKKNVFPEYDFDTQTGDIRPHLFFAAWDSDYDAAVSDIAGAPSDMNKVTWLTKWAHFAVDPYAEWDDYDAYYADCNIPVFRHTGIMLLLAEAYCKDKQYDKAKVIVDDIRSRAGLGPYSGGNAELIDEVCQQMYGELIGEGHSYYDMIRNNYFPNGHLMRPAKYKAEGYYWPVSAGILKANTMIEQTPYWNGKTRW